MLAVALLAAAAGRVLLSGDDAPGPLAERDFVAIQDVPRAALQPAAGPDASSGSFVTACGRNGNAHINADNMITKPGEPGAAQHHHEYVGNLSTDAFSTDTSLALAGTTCRNGDLSVYAWPVLQVLTRHGDETGTGKAHAGDAGATNTNPSEHGLRIQPGSVLVEFRGNPTSNIVAMPRFLRIVEGNARATTTAPVSTAQWSCTGYTDRRTHRYPLCPAGKQVLRIYDFPSCWDGRRTDSPDHRAHVSYPAVDGTCPHDTFPVPQLHLEIAYTVPPGRSFVVDSFPDQRHNPATDHSEFVNVIPDGLMAHVVACLNRGRRC